MDKLKKSKEAYDTIRIPEELEEVVKNAIRQSAEKKGVTGDQGEEESLIRNGKITNGFPVFCRRFAVAAAALLVVAVIAANSGEVFAKEMQKIPVVGAIIKLLTIRSYEKDDGSKKISVEVPGVEFIGEEVNGFSDEVNESISSMCNDYAQEALKRADEYRIAFMETGGTEEEWAEHHIEIKVWYDIKSQTDAYLSFTVSGTESWTSAYAETKFYNLDLKNLRYLTLEDVLGKDYIKIANESIKVQMKQRETENKEKFWKSEEGGFQSIYEGTRFYLNEKGNPVIVFDKYEIGPGSIGEAEFEIERME